ncbi:hypothetical protein Cs7R123_43280 [Catellatospora sp. TT07R-123]|uniref:MEDS domain-containing protein n=1 Tax=Catellatospora sp. TT07R-123 TaxID=2733863 RepID=UPI001B007C76|nr:MEDS domain-containing protein [Catellatospora sp. TT07R-123]GHJ46986.1 hypothetical protein Cs7R123_43280 [Catellatospora sp. TT07R-123]
MRQSGFVDAVDGLGRSDHLCWAFDTHDEFRTLAARFLADGLAAGQQVVYLAESAGAAELDGFGGFAAARASGAARVQDLSIYDRSLLAEPRAQVRAYAQATEQALAAGYTGLRVAADATPLVRTPADRSAFARYEHLVDVYMTRHPFAAMCGYHRGRLDPAAIAELACMHPLARSSSAPLRLFASDQPGIDMVLAGEVDLAGHALLRTALEHADAAPAGGEISVDARHLTFIDHRGLMRLAEHVQARGGTAVLHTARGATRLLTELLDLPQLRVSAS